MSWLIADYEVVIGICILLVVCIFSLYKFIKLGKEKQVAKIKEWLLYTCIEAERVLGSGTGEIKLRYVYNLFCSRFPLIVLVISFETFDRLVDQSLEKMREILSEDENIIDNK